ncbi:MAG: NUDIX domain-containing protein [Bacteroidetes bacterium]|nr:MAG: NUDIX domain-containing protein [Bacteroidota bacterium]
MVILRADDQFLLLRRAKPPNVGLYAPVGGKVDPYEDPYQTGLRETLEETGIAVPKLKYVGSLVETSPVAYNWWCSIYLADIAWQPAPPCDEGRLEWIPCTQLDQIPTPPTDAAVYQYVAREQPFAMRAIFDAELRMLSLAEEIEGKLLYEIPH